ncbi:LppX_LprAFG lipoprotein [Actinocrispum wychmicini]|uniref:Lipoprotein LprG n=1 Tax=Actinocrispum wychmicini TaxID=1213861 RepID=A0A4R2JG42_9PSEU|nr:LppX_LprAFG lipoprotein [Actinocrispum wychmicini]TCO58741.1 lipoprotein LprG [Actinocrispum wychmicini]
MVKRLVMLSVLGLVAVAGCSSTSTPDSASLPDGTGLLKDAATASKSFSSAHFTMNVTGQVPGLPISQLDGDLNKAGDAKGHAKLSQFGTLIDVEFVVADKTIYIKGPTGSFQRFGDASKVFDTSAILDPDRGVGKLLGTVSAAKTEAAEDVAGAKTYRVTGKVTKEGLTGLVPGIQSDVNVKVWVRQDNPHQPVKATIEVTPGNSVDISLSDVDKPVTVTKPV